MYCNYILDVYYVFGMLCIIFQLVGIKERDVFVKLFILFLKVQEFFVILLLLVYVLKNEEKFDYRFMVSKDNYGLNLRYGLI